MAKIQSIEPPPSYVYEDGDCLVRVYDKDGEPLTNANVFFSLCKAAIDLITAEDEE
jgi:hypothetical protein